MRGSVHTNLYEVHAHRDALHIHIHTHTLLREAKLPHKCFVDLIHPSIDTILYSFIAHLVSRRQSPHLSYYDFKKTENTEKMRLFLLVGIMAHVLSGTHNTFDNADIGKIGSF